MNVNEPSGIPDFRDIPVIPANYQAFQDSSVVVNPNEQMPALDMTKINITKVTLQVGYPIWMQPTGNNRKERRNNKKFKLRFVGTVQDLADLQIKKDMQAGDTWYVRNDRMNYFYSPSKVAYDSRWVGVILRPTVEGGKVKACEVKIQHDKQMVANY